MQWNLPSNEQLHLYRSLFNVREDVFAIRWEKGKKKGYYPAYQFDPYRYRLHKIKGGSLKDFPDKSPLKLDDSQLVKHFIGDQFIGGYPLLLDNNSWFIAADFDGENWKEESLKFIKACQKYYISPYLERSQSGNGAHVWVFFDEVYPALKSRSAITFLLKKAGIISEFDKESSFDRLFPNQDQLTGKKLGNLIALPFHGNSMLANNSCFIENNYIKGRSLAKEQIEAFDLSKGRELSSLYNSEEEIIDSLLTNLDAKHGRQLKYLAEKHQSHLVKLRFVLHPFSFLFLIAGEQQFHIVLETLDTEEATYIWHYEKDLGLLKKKVQEVNQALEIIKNEGRLKYQEQAMANFSRILHDYSDDRKGFIIWRDQLEERLV